MELLGTPSNMGLFNNIFSRLLNGLVPASGGTSGTTKFLREDGSWAVPAGGAGGGMSNPMLNPGDMIYSADGSGTPAALGIGTAGQHLMSNGADPYWGNPSLNYDGGGAVQPPNVINIDMGGA